MKFMSFKAHTSSTVLRRTSTRLTTCTHGKLGSNQESSKYADSFPSSKLASAEKIYFAKYQGLLKYALHEEIS